MSDSFQDYLLKPLAHPSMLAEMVGIEPTISVLETDVIPLNYIPMLAAVAGLEPANA